MIIRMKYKKTIIIIILVLVAFAISGFFLVLNTKSQVKDLFRMNKELQEAGYYMGDFEFKMMGILYWLDKGEFYRALAHLNKLHTQFETKKGLIKMPKFANKDEEIEFYLNLQNPKTGAFIDDIYPYATYNEVTENIINHLDTLTKESGQTLKLKYLLKYLDEINTPEKLKVFLDDVAYVGWISTKFPQTSYVFARSILSYSNGEGVIEEKGFYKFSDEWKQALLQWFYENQDSETGFWGPRSRDGHKLLEKDLTNTASIIKAFVDKDGNNLNPSFSLRYGSQMFKTALEVMSEPAPDVDDLDEWHEWELKMGKGTYMLTRYVWQYALEEDKARAKELIENLVRTNFANCYIPEEGAFSYYPNGEHASLDGSGFFSIFKDIGALSSEKQGKLWGASEKLITDLGTQKTSVLIEKDFELISGKKEINSLRVYKTEADYNNLMLGVYAIIYPDKSSILDIIELTAKMKKWIDATPLTMGNWTSKEEVRQELEAVDFEEAPVYEKPAGIEKLNTFLQENGKAVVVGFDALQIPRYRITFEL
ncbi:MAG: hypothetical protein US83_C0004G0084 [Candidatus Falkowbacteria bacterium GW2011_GWC2_38_22]|uniref:Uncharacterized protein n=1 Tax=Candidatus Falkowbacteria bacterium GW2011_GWE1_38_31 TaxID=1618638 RepID=A0A0G0JSL5_9BACT|nr:MAG: hypothetical protein US73_C0002G0033 [Candidatus Falkowbacteria bacterium GW2011_GWF2_38_1205]KKQ61700.1 MAG: hypothetical protein US83_C0004G0084 [Candidatus Falkowbacteria bacterium GW2011_GWC2_38_22]KKQ63685.1 MAG: hypothetical protein US84_C0004G0033 [Candidatus Falkowbacteria bacterium GW2011_GWF1_38_22]KKQ65899.1 MAG: hypothetical protein US87_C0004G0084 [Candidatus Falkowbacteria bacterium GW2011_GWE2_38_254]KKQ70548.1 MAG: hypothetical protein US91_C0004G0033 [Candidatus Falkowb